MSERKFYVGAQNDMLYIISGRAPAINNDYPVHDADRTCVAKVFDQSESNRLVAQANKAAELESKLAASEEARKNLAKKLDALKLKHELMLPIAQDLEIKLAAAERRIKELEDHNSQYWDAESAARRMEELQRENAELTAANHVQEVVLENQALELAATQHVVEQMRERLTELHDEVDYQLVSNFPSVYRLQEENERSSKILALQVSTDALDEYAAKVLDDASKEMRKYMIQRSNDSRYDGTKFDPVIVLGAMAENRRRTASERKQGE